MDLSHGTDGEGTEQKTAKILADGLEFFTEGNSEGLREQAKARKEACIPTELILPGANQTDDESKDVSL